MHQFLPKSQHRPKHSAALRSLLLLLVLIVFSSVTSANSAMSGKREVKVSDALRRVSRAVSISPPSRMSDKGAVSQTFSEFNCCTRSAKRA